MTLQPLTRTEASSYLETKLRSAGRSVPAFSPRSVARIHLLSGGVPRGIDRLATMVLAAGARRELDLVSADLVDETARLGVGSPEFPAVT